MTQDADCVACPRCGQRTMIVTHRLGTPKEPSRECPNCGWEGPLLIDGEAGA